MYSFTDQMKSLGKTPKTELLEFKISKSNKVIASKLNIREEDKIIKLKYLRKADDIPMMVERTYLPYNKFPNLHIEELSKNPLYLVMKNNFNQCVYIVNETIQASLIALKDAKLLEITSNAPCLKVKRTAFNKLNIPIEYTDCVARGDQFVYNYNYIHQENN